MRGRFACCSIALLIAVFMGCCGSVAAQTLAPAYRFETGKRCVYRYVFDQTGRPADGGGGDSYIHTVTLEIEVDSVDDAGNSELLCKVLSQGYTRKNETERIRTQLKDSITIYSPLQWQPFAETPKRNSQKLMANRPDMTPRFRVTLTPNGMIKSGTVLEKSDSQREMDSLRRLPNVRSSGIDELRLLRNELKMFFSPIPHRDDFFYGCTWDDTTTRVSDNSKVVELRTWSYHKGVGPDSLPCSILTEKTESRRIMMWPGGEPTEYSVKSEKQIYFLEYDGMYLGFDILANSTYTHEREDGSAVSDSTTFVCICRLTKE